MSRRRMLWVGLLVLVAAHPAFAQPKERRRVLIVGDSITQEQLMPEFKGTLRKGLRDLGCTIVGTGRYSDCFGGFTSYNLEKLLTNVSNPQADIVLTQSGTNDAILYINNPGRALKDRRNLLRQIRKLFPQALILVAPVPPVAPAYVSPPGIDVNRNIAKLNADTKSWVTNLGDRKMAWIRDFAPIDWPASRFRPDGVHPSTEGLSFITKRWLAAIQAHSR